MTYARWVLINSCCQRRHVATNNMLIGLRTVIGTWRPTQASIRIYGHSVDILWEQRARTIDVRASRPHLISWLFVRLSTSGDTRVGDTRGGSWGCHPYFFPEKLTTFFTRRCLPVLRCHHYLFSPKKVTTFLLITLTFIDFTRVSPTGGCHPAPFSSIRPRFSTNCKFAHNFFPLGVTPWRVSPGAVPPSPYWRHCCRHTTADRVSSSLYSPLLVSAVTCLPHPHLCKTF